MNFKSAILSFLFIVYGSSFIVANAQQNPGEIVIGAGVGHSSRFDGKAGAGFLGYPIPNNAYSGDDWNVLSYTDYWGITADFGLVNWLSLGVAGGYQSEEINWSNGDDKITRINVAGRLLFHIFPDNNNLDIYAGFRAGGGNYNDVQLAPPRIPQGPQYFIIQPNVGYASFQVILFGFRLYFANFIGIHGEFALGAPYLIEGGLTFRINHEKS